MSETPCPSRASRKARGAYYTPEPLAAALAGWAARRADGRLLDPACGDGRFVAAHRHGLGVERDADAARTARARAPDACVIEADFFAWAEDCRQRFDGAAGNPPFIRYQTFNGAARAGLGAQRRVGDLQQRPLGGASPRPPAGDPADARLALSLRPAELRVGRPCVGRRTAQARTPRGRPRRSARGASAHRAGAVGDRGRHRHPARLATLQRRSRDGAIGAADLAGCGACAAWLLAKAGCWDSTGEPLIKSSCGRDARVPRRASEHPRRLIRDSLAATKHGRGRSQDAGETPALSGRLDRGGALAHSHAPLRGKQGGHGAA